MIVYSEASKPFPKMAEGVAVPQSSGKPQPRKCICAMVKAPYEKSSTRFKKDPV